MTRTAPALLLTLAVLLAGCAGDDAAEQTAAADAPGPQFELPTPAPIEQQTTVTVDAFLDENPEGRFRVYWPSGCGSQRQRELDSRRNRGAVAAVEVSCRREGDPDSGCQVIAYDETTTGEPPTPEMVADSIGDYVSRLGVEIWRQVEINRRGEQGVAVFCREMTGRRQVWIQGFIEHDRVFIAVAWGPDESLYSDPEIRRFFDTLESTAG